MQPPYRCRRDRLIPWWPASGGRGPHRPARAQAAFAAAYPQLCPDTAAQAFSSESANFSQPTLTVADIRHEIANLPANANPIDPASILYSK
jgi:hypothetical protein